MNRRTIFTAVAAVSLLVTGAGVAIVGHSPTAVAAGATASGLPWQSGAYLDNHTAYVPTFATARGRAMDVAESFVTQDNASEIGTDDWWYAAAAKPVTDAGGTFLLTVPLWAANQSVSTSASTMNAMWANLGKTLVRDGIASKTVIRLGWEMNISDWYWKLTTANQAAWITDFERAVTTVRANAPGVRFAFNPNEGVSQSCCVSNTVLDQVATTLAPYYEFAGPDFYDQGQTGTASAWAARYTATGGLKHWEDFATAQGKGYMIPEWGLVSGLTPAGETGTFYVQQMVGRFQAMSARTSVIEALFNDPSSGGSFFAMNASTPANWPAAGTAYKNALAAVIVTPLPRPSSVPSSPGPTPSASTGC
jgi:hypothetical protein